MRAVLSQDDLDIAYIAATKGARPVLTCVKIGDGKILAADGFMLAMRHIETDPLEGESILIPASILLSARRILLKENIVIKSADKNKATIRAEKLVEIEITVPIFTSATYPPYEQIMPKENCKAYVTLDPTKLRKLMKAFDKSNGWLTQFKLRESTSPVEIISGNTRLYIMPINSEEKK